MSSMGDGVSKYFLVYHKNNFMNFCGEKTLIDIADLAMRKHTCTMSKEERNAALDELTEKLKKCFHSWDDADE